jgi:hypothetical protein
MRTTRIMRDALLLFIAVLLIATAFAIGARAQKAYGAEFKAHTEPYYRQAVKGQHARFRDAAVTIRAQRR